MKSKLELLKPFSDRLARLCCSDEPRQATRMLRQLGLLEPSAATSLSDAAEDIGSSKKAGLSRPAGLGRVGIWEPKRENNQAVFVRSKDMAPDWHLWANVGRIESKKARRRVLLIGESVARGFLYDPQFTPAMALEAILQARLGKTEIEVIDLARTNLGFEVRELAISAIDLDPDLVIVFSGNNWDKNVPTDVPLVDTLLLEHGAYGLKEFVAQELSQQVDQTVRELISFYEKKKIPLVWILPEFNLGYWRDSVTNAPHLPEGMNVDWIRLRKEAEDALAEGRLQEASEAALTMMKLDGGTCVTELYILADCCKLSGDLEGTRRYLELARDATIWDTSRNVSPRTYSVTEEVLRRRIPQDSHRLVDLPKLFKEYLHGEIPDRRLFVDYCHLTSEGIQIAMAAAASSTLYLLTGIDVPWCSLLKQGTRPSSRIEAETAFLAAIHNAHWWQSYELVHHYCRRAKASPDVATIMSTFIEVQIRRAPLLICKATERIALMGSPLMQHYLLRFNYQRLDTLLLEAIVSALEEKGVALREELDRLRKEEHSVTHKEANLLDYYYCSEGSQQEVMWVVPHLGIYLNHKTNHYYKAFWRESKFVFVGEENSPVRLRLTCRLPDFGLAEGSVSLLLNGEPVGKLSISRKWTTWDIEVPGGMVRDAVNQLTLHWPMPVFPGLNAFSSVAGNLMEKLYPEFFCVFGEIHFFTAFDARKAPSQSYTDATQLSAIEVA